MVRRKMHHLGAFFLFVKNTQNICKYQKNVVPLQQISQMRETKTNYLNN